MGLVWLWQHTALYWAARIVGRILNGISFTQRFEREFPAPGIYTFKTCTIHSLTSVRHLCDSNL